MNRADNLTERVAPPDRAAEILREMGYPVSGKLLRRMYKDGSLPGTWTGKRVLIPISKAIDIFENGTSTNSGYQSGQIRRIEV